MDVMKPDTAVILAGGFGTRIRPLTDKIPKPLLPIKGKPILEHIIINLKKYGITNIVLLVHHMAEKIEDHFGDGSRLGVRITYSEEEEPLGTGGAIKLASSSFTRPFLALNGDNLADFNYDEMWKVHAGNKADITIALFPVRDVTKFGIAELDGPKIIRFLEKPSVHEAPTNLNNAGAYIFNPDVIKMLPDGRCSVEQDCFEKMCGKDGKVYGYMHDSQWFPTDDIDKYNTAQKNFREDLI